MSAQVHGDNLSGSFDSVAEQLRHAIEVVEVCRRQRRTLIMQRERVGLYREFSHTKARLQLRKTFRQEIEKSLEAVVRPLIESVDEG